jgi:hypothetical protein
MITITQLILIYLRANSTAQGPITKLARGKERNKHTQSTKYFEGHETCNTNITSLYY